jgi:golgin subfamily B member 1
MQALIYRDQLNDPIAAMDALKLTLERDQEVSGLVDAFESLLTEPEVRLDAAKSLAPIYRKSERWEPYVKVLIDTLEDRLDLGEKVDVYRDISNVKQTYLGDLNGAFDSLKSAYILDPDLVEVELELDELSSQVERDAEWLEALEHALNEVPNREIDLRIKIAEIAEHRLQDFERAITSYQEILYQEPEHLQSMDALEELLKRTSAFANLAELYNRKIDVMSEAEDRAEVYARLASLLSLRASSQTLRGEIMRSRMRRSV